MKILTAAQMSEVDRLTTERYRIPSLLLMENAGRSVVDEIEKARKGLTHKRIVVLCGRGNNGGDGFVVARYLALRGANPEILLFADPGKLGGDAKTNWEIAQAMKLSIQVLPDGAKSRTFLRKIPFPDVVVDALFGTGLSKPIGSEFRPVIEWTRRAAETSFIVAVDIPSGLFADKGSVPGPAVKAHLTVTFSALKLAHILPPASDLAGHVVVAPIGSPSPLFENPRYLFHIVDETQVSAVIPGRIRDSHKGTYGHVHIVAGSRGKSGAALMTGIAALRSGAGLATLWVPETLQRDLTGKYPELMTEPLLETDKGTPDRADADRVLAQSGKMDSLVIGPGLTTHPSTKGLVWELVRSARVPVVLDADGINAFAPPAGPLENSRRQPVVITPHPGEMADLTGRKIPVIQADRIGAASDFAVQKQCYVILKGFQTIIATPEGEAYINRTGNPGMATGGAGDVLSGMVGRFLAGWGRRRNSPDCPMLVDFLCAAVYLHGLAGDLAAEAQGEESLIATDLLRYLPQAFSKVRSR